MQHILVIDQGTTSTRALVYREDFQPVAMAQQEFAQLFPQDGWVEHDPETIWQSVLATGRSAIARAQLSAADIAGIGITNQRETVVAWDKTTGEAIYNAIVWQDRRSSSACNKLQSEGLEALFQARTGLLIDPYFSATKIQWILENIPQAAHKASKGELLVGTVDTYLLWRMTKGRLHTTDTTNASRTLLFNIHTQDWDQELLQALGIPAHILPRVQDCAANFGTCDSDWFGAAIPICAVAGDQQSALIGQACIAPGLMKSTYGTGCFAVVNTGSQLVSSGHRLLTTVAYRLQGKTTYALEGSIFMAGAIVQWLRDRLGIITHAADTEPLAASTQLDQPEILVPAFTGLGAPYWLPNARAALFGMTRNTGRAEIAAAALHSVAFQTADLLQAMIKDGVNLASMRVDGGMTDNAEFLQRLANITGIPILSSGTKEATALGAARLCAYQLGIYPSLEAACAQWQISTEFLPETTEVKRQALLTAWHSAVNKVRE